MNKKLKTKLKQIIALFVLNCFLLSYVYGPALASINDGKAMVEKYKNIFSDFMLPYTYGQIVKSHYAGTDRVVINIQDLHCHPKVQKNISNIIELFDRQYGVANIYLEGAYGDVDTKWLQGDTKTVDKILETGRLTGAEYYSVISGKTKIIKGLEAKDPYLDNLKRFSSIVENQDTINLILDGINESTKKLKENYYTKRQYRLERLSENYKKGKIKPEKYYVLLNKHIDRLGIDIYKYKHTLAYMTLIGMQKELDYKAINADMRNFMLLLNDHLSPDLYKMLSDNTEQFSRVDKLYGYIREIARQYDLNLDINYGNLNKYFKYLELSRKINPLKLVSEEQAMLQEINTRFSETKAQREAVFLIYFERYLRDFLNSKITVEDYEYYKENIETYKELWNKYVDNRVLSLLDGYIAEADKFYEINNDRNTYFTDIILEPGKPLQIEGKKEAEDDAGKIIENMGEVKRLDIIITGGFHTDTVSNILKENDISYIVITPNVTDGAKEAEETYYGIAMEQGKFSFQTLATLPLSLYGPEAKVRVSVEAFGMVEAERIFGKEEVDAVLAKPSPLTQEELDILSLEAKKREVEFAKVLDSDDEGHVVEKIVKLVQENVSEELKGKVNEDLLARADPEKLEKALASGQEELEKFISILSETNPIKKLMFSLKSVLPELKSLLPSSEKEQFYNIKEGSYIFITNLNTGSFEVIRCQIKNVYKVGTRVETRAYEDDLERMGVDKLEFDDNGNIKIRIKEGFELSSISIDGEPQGREENNKPFSEEQMQAMTQDVGAEGYVDIFLDDDEESLLENMHKAIESNKLMVVHVFRKGFDTQSLTLAQLYDKYRQAYRLLQSDKLKHIFPQISENERSKEKEQIISSDFFLKELLKKSFAHGNLGMFEAPMAFYIQVNDEGNISEIVTYNPKDFGADSVLRQTTRRLMNNALIFGDHKANEYMGRSILRNLSQGSEVLNGIEFYKARSGLRTQEEQAQALADYEKYLESLSKRTFQDELNDFWGVYQTRSTVDRLYRKGLNKYLDQYLKQTGKSKEELTEDDLAEIQQKAQNYRYTSSGIAYGVFLETFDFFSSTFIDKHDYDPSIRSGMRAVIWRLRAISIGGGILTAVSMALMFSNPILLLGFFPATIFSSWISHYAYNKTQVSKGSTDRLLQTSQAAETKRIKVNKDNLEEILNNITGVTDDSEQNNFISFVSDIDFNNMLVEFEKSSPLSETYAKILQKYFLSTLKGLPRTDLIELMSFFNKVEEGGELEESDKEFLKKLLDKKNTKFNVENKEEAIKTIARLYAVITYNEINIGSLLSNWNISMQSWIHICEGHFIGFNKAKDENTGQKFYYEDEDPANFAITLEKINILFEHMMTSVPVATIKLAKPDSFGREQYKSVYEINIAGKQLVFACVFYEDSFGKKNIKSIYQFSNHFYYNDPDGIDYDRDAGISIKKEAGSDKVIIIKKIDESSSTSVEIKSIDVDKYYSPSDSTWNPIVYEQPSISSSFIIEKNDENASWTLKFNEQDVEAELKDNVFWVLSNPNTEHEVDDGSETMIGIYHNIIVTKQEQKYYYYEIHRIGEEEWFITDKSSRRMLSEVSSHAHIRLLGVNNIKIPLDFEHQVLLPSDYEIIQGVKKQNVFEVVIDKDGRKIIMLENNIDLENRMKVTFNDENVIWDKNGDKEKKISESIVNYTKSREVRNYYDDLELVLNKIRENYFGHDRQISDIETSYIYLVDDTTGRKKQLLLVIKYNGVEDVDVINLNGNHKFVYDSNSNSSTLKKQVVEVSDRSVLGEIGDNISSTNIPELGVENTISSTETQSTTMTWLANLLDFLGVEEFDNELGMLRKIVSDKEDYDDDEKYQLIKRLINNKEKYASQEDFIFDLGMLWDVLFSEGKRFYHNDKRFTFLQRLIDAKDKFSSMEEFDRVLEMLWEVVLQPDAHEVFFSVAEFNMHNFNLLKNSRLAKEKEEDTMADIIQYYRKFERLNTIDSLMLNFFFSDFNIPEEHISKIESLISGLADKTIGSLALENNAFAIQIFFNNEFQELTKNIESDGFIENKIVMQYRIAVILARMLYLNKGNAVFDLPQEKFNDIITIAYDHYLQIADVAKKTVVLDENTYISTLHNYQKIFAMDAINKILAELGIHDKRKAEHFKADQEKDNISLTDAILGRHLAEAESWLDSIANFQETKTRLGLKRGYFLFNGHADFDGDKGYLIYGKFAHITSEEIVKALLKAKDNGANLEDITIDLSSCHSWHIANEIYERLESEGIKELPQIITAANFETPLAYGDLFDLVVNYLRFPAIKSGKIADKTDKALTLLDVHRATPQFNNHTVFVSSEKIQKINENFKEALNEIVPVDGEISDDAFGRHAVRNIRLATLQTKATIEKLDKIGKFLKVDNFKHTALGVGIGAILEIFSLWSPRFISQHENPTAGMIATVWVIRALSIMAGAGVLFSPFSPALILPAVFLTELITHFTYNMFQVSKDISIEEKDSSKTIASEEAIEPSVVEDIERQLADEQEMDIEEPLDISITDIVIDSAKKSTSPSSTVQEMSIKIVKGEQAIRELESNIADMSTSLIITETQSSAENLRSQGFKAVTARVVQERGGDQIGQYNDLKVRAKWNQDKTEILLCLKDLNVSVDKEELLKMLLDALNEGRQTDILYGVSQLVITNENTIDGAVDAIKNAHTDSVMKPVKEAKFDLSERNISGNIEVVCTREASATGAQIFVLNIEQAEKNKDEIKTLREQGGLRYVVSYKSSDEVGEILYDGAKVDASNITDIKKAEDFLRSLRTKALRKDAGLSLSVKFNDDIYKEFVKENINIFKEYGIIPIISADSKYLNALTLGKVEVEDITEKNVEEVLQNDMVVTIVVDDARVLSDKKEKLKEIKTKGQKYAKGYNASLNSKFDYTTEDINKLSELLTADINDKEEVLAEMWKNVPIDNMGLSQDSRSYIKYLLERNRYEEAIGFVRGIAMNSAERILFDKLGEMQISIDEEKFRNASNGMFQKAQLTLLVRLLIEGEDIDVLLQDNYLVYGTMTAEEYIESVKTDVNENIEDIIKDNEYKVNKLTNPTQAIADFQKFNLLMQDSFRGKVVMKNVKVSALAVRSILGAA